MTPGVGAMLPVTSAPPAIDGEVADPAASQPFLAALAAAVAAPVTPPPAPVVDVPLVVADAPASEDGAPTVDADAAAATERALLTLVGPSTDATPEGMSRRAAGTDRADGDPVDEVATQPSDSDAAEGARLRVLLADRAAPRAATTRAPASPATAATHAHDETSRDDVAPLDDDERTPRGKTLGATNRATPAVAALHTPGQDVVPAVPATPSWHAATQALATPSRTPLPDPAPAPEAPLAAPVTPSPIGDFGRPAGNASSTAAGVLAALHAAHLAKEEGNVVASPVARFAEQVVASVTARPDAEPGAEAEGHEPAIVGAVVTGSEDAASAPLLTPLRVAMTARPASPGGERDAAHEHRDEAPGQERRTLTPAATGSTEAPVDTGRTPWMAAERANAPAATEGAAPTVHAHRTAEAPAAPRAPTSQVTVELDAEQTGAQRVRVAVRGDVVHATVVTDRGGAEAMRPQLDDLRHALEGQGFREARVQLRVASDGTPVVSGGTVPELRTRTEAASRAPDGSGAEQQPRGRQRGHDHQPPPGGQPAFEEDLL